MTRSIQFVIVAVAHFSKWIEAEASQLVNEDKVITFASKSVFCKFGVPKVLIINNGKFFIAKLLPYSI